MHPVLKQYLEMCVETGRKMPNRHPDMKWTCIEELVLKFGRPFEQYKRQPKYPPGEPKMCFGNSAMLLVRDQDLLYVEGFGLLKGSGFPIHHAWNCKTGSNKVIDTTTENLEHYCGVVFQRQYIYKRIGKGLGGMSLLDNWKEDFPLLRASEEELRAKILA